MKDNKVKGGLSMGFTIIANTLSKYQEEPGITDIIIPENVNVISPSVFSGCTSIESVIIPEGVTCIEEFIFEGCCNLKSVQIPETVVSIKHRAFSGCSQLQSINIPKNVREIRSLAFSYCTNLTDVTIQEGIKVIGPSAFKSCRNLSAISFPRSLKEIHSGAFENCSGLTSAVVPEGVMVCASAFDGCVNLPEHISSERKEMIQELIDNHWECDLINDCRKADDYTASIALACLRNNLDYQVLLNLFKHTNIHEEEYYTIGQVLDYLFSYKDGIKANRVSDRLLCETFNMLNQAEYRECIMEDKYSVYSLPQVFLNYLCDKNGVPRLMDFDEDFENYCGMIAEDIIDGIRVSFYLDRYYEDDDGRRDISGNLLLRDILVKHGAKIASHCIWFSNEQLQEIRDRNNISQFIDE